MVLRTPIASAVFLFTGILAAHAEPSALRWSGFYAGVHLGSAIGDAEFKMSPNDALKAGDPLTAADIARDSRQKARDTGFLGGAHVGYGWQFGRWVVGLEGDFGLLDSEIRSTPGTIRSAVGTFYDYDQKARVSALATLRPKIGFVIENVHVFATAGLAVGDVETRQSVVINAGSAPPVGSVLSSRNDDWELGWTVGGGIEAALSDRWSLKAEYLFVDLSRQRSFATSNTLPTFGTANTAEITENVIRAGLSYRF